MNSAWRFSTLPNTARTVWAKSGDVHGHGVLAHLLDVAAVAEVMLEREPASTRYWVDKVFGLSLRDGLRWIAALVGLHDFGKAIPGFQCKWEDGLLGDQAAGLSFTQRSQTVSDHACATAALLGEHLLRQGSAELPWIRHVLQAVSAHHGYNFLATEIDQSRPRREGTEWAEARRVLFETYWSTLSPQGGPTIGELTAPAVEWMAGLTSVADWIGSNPDWFPLGERFDRLDEYFADAKVRAARALDTIGWLPYSGLLDGSTESSTAELLARILQQRRVDVRPLQHEGDRLLVGAQGPALLLVEAPMGEGKTELAFLAHLRLQMANQHRGLYVALPTQATGNALFDRTLTFLRAFAGDRHLDVQLVHGGASLNEQVQQLRDINYSKSDSIGASAWFSQRRRPLLSPYGVGTVDQALFAALNVKHHFVRLWGLSNRVVVLDEVHAYDIYTTGLIEALLRWLKALGSSVVLMSATLPHGRRDALLRAWGVPLRDVPEMPYPRLVLADDRGVGGATFASRPMPSIQLVGINETPDALIACALEQLGHGGCGALIVNTVDRAQQIFCRLREGTGDTVELLLFHARFPADQRAVLEKSVLEKFGKGGARPGKALLIATQVAEQSLDIDFDFMLTDLAPVDLVLQRAGRLHRHQRQRPAAHKEARLFVAGLHREGLPDFKGTAWQYVYDAYILGRTWALLSRESVLYLPQDIDRLVQAVYGDDDLPDDLEQEARNSIEVESFGEYRAQVNYQRMLSISVAIDPSQEPQNAYLQKPRGNEEGDGLGLTNRTRLSEESITVVPVCIQPDGWSIDKNSKPFDPDKPLSDDVARRLYARQLRLSRKAVVKYFAGQEPPCSFAEHPLLQHLKPLPLKNGRFEISANLTLRLDGDLGLVYEREISPIQGDA